MIRYLKGFLASKEDSMIVVETGGIGYAVNVPAGSPLYLEQVGEDVKVFIHMAVKEDDVSLYGFASEQELALFRMLITVSGVGAKAAMAVLSAMPVTEIKKAIVFEDADMIARAQGIGKKTAQKIVLELRDKLEGVIATGGEGETIPNRPPELTDNKEQALDALMNLGYSRMEALSAMNGIEGDDLSVEEYIKQALKNRA